jgi:poly-gamma-glutamate capsule biosynthesis protein CapA/YwtB (metallophosphatase superfamily)
MNTKMKPHAAVRVALAVVLVGLCVFGLTVVLQNGKNTVQAVSSSIRSSIPETSAVSSELPVSVSSQPASKPEQKTASITILGTGDNLIHDVIYQQAKQRTGGKGYDFKPVYARIENDIKNADIAIINQETPLASKIAAPSGYPRFNSPTQLGDDLVSLGFDVINHANNHVLDMNEKGLAATLDYWETKPTVKVIGAYRNDADLENIRIIETKGIKTAYLGVTEMTNGLSLPKNSNYRLIYTSNTALIERLIKKAKAEADIVVVTAHWGTENTTKLTEKQKSLSQDMVDWGADIIFGDHPHVLQQLTVLKRKDGTECPVVYSLGNLVSAQQSGPNMVSGLLTVTMTKDFGTGKTTFTSMKFKPTVTQYGKRCANITIYPLSEYSDSLADAHGVRKFTPNFNLSYIQNIIDKNIPQKYQSKD